MRFQYQLCGFKLLSELECPELLPLRFRPNEAEITIQFGSISKEGLINPLKKTDGFQAKKEEFWMHIPNLSRFLVTHGCKIIIDPFDGVDESSIRLFLFGSCFGALLMQRGFFILHGNAIRIGNTAISIIGDSGVGKSTLSASFVKKGYSILTDDICVINSAGEVLPSLPQIKLWDNAVKKLSIDIKTLRKIRPNIEKYAVPLEENFYSSPLSLRLVYILNMHHENVIGIKNINGFKKYQALCSHVYRHAFVDGLAQQHCYKINGMRLARQVDLAQLTRPIDGNSSEELTEFIESDLRFRGFL